MARQPNTDTQGRPFSESTVNQAWNKGGAIPNYDPQTMRYDACGKIILRSHYGKADSEYGWEVDHIKPVAKGGGDELSNLQPLYWKTNRIKGDTYPWRCP